MAGIAGWSQCRPPGTPHEEGRRLLLGEVNAAIDGAMAAGATAIICNDSHGTMNNLDPAGLRGRAAYVSGRHKPMYMMQGLDSSAGVVFMVGYHGSVSGESSVLSHTCNPGRNVRAKAGLNLGIPRSGWGLLVRRLETKLRAGRRAGHADVNAAINIAAGHPTHLPIPLHSRAGLRDAGPANREPHLLASFTG